MGLYSNIMNQASGHSTFKGGGFGDDDDITSISENKTKTVNPNSKPLKGSGKPLRQFIYSKNLAELILWSLLEYNKSENIILSVGENDETSIREVAIEISKAFNYENNIIFDTQYSDGQYKKTSNNSL